MEMKIGVETLGTHWTLDYEGELCVNDFQSDIENALRDTGRADLLS